MKLYKFCRMCINEAKDDDYFMDSCDFAKNNKKLLFELYDRNLISFNKGQFYWRITYQTKFKARFFLSIAEYSTIGGILIFFFSLVQFINLLISN